MEPRAASEQQANAAGRSTAAIQGGRDRVKPPPDSDAQSRRRAGDQLIRPTRAEIDLAALRQNVAEIRRLAPRVEMLGIVKANAYGHGAVPIARALEREQVGMLGVALVEEGLELRNAGIRAPILVLGGSYDGSYQLMAEHDLTATVFRPEQVAELAEASRRIGRPLKAHLKLDSGTGRLGVLPDDLDDFLDQASRFPHVQMDGLLSHFASADLENAEFTLEQLRRFTQALARMRARGLRPTWRHLSNSAGVIELPEVRDGVELNMVRPGIMLYGLAPAAWMEGSANLAPVMSWKTAVVHLKRVPSGTPISYGGTWRAPRPSTIATLPVGYADGYVRHFSNRSQVLIRGQRAPVVGRVCMDLCMVDVTEVAGVAMGDEVVLLGAQGEEQIPADELAQLAGTIHYEVLCGVSARVPRIVLNQT